MAFSTFLHGWLQKCIEIINVKFIYIIGFPVFPWVIPNQLLLNCFSRVRLYVTPETAAHQAPLSLGFSRQEHWNGLPFPSPMHESEK